MGRTTPTLFGGEKPPRKEYLMPRRVRDTSIKAYHRIMESGKLAATRALVLRHFIDNHPGTCTERELDDQMHDVNAHKRVSELQDMGLLEEVGERECNVSSNPSSIEWGLRDNPILIPLVREPGKHGVKKVEIVVSDCCECLFRDTDDTCMGVTSGGEVKCVMPTGRPCGCPLFEVTYAIRGA
jgi:hypothetical protein